MTTALESLTPVQFRALPMSGDLYKFADKYRVPRVLYHGDSKANLAGRQSCQSYDYWAFALIGAEYKYDGTKDNFGVDGAVADNSTTTSAVNGNGQNTVLGFATDTNIALAVTRAQACVAAGETVISRYQLGTNNAGAADSQVLAALKKHVAAMRGAGVSLFLINDIPPLYSTTVATQQAFASFNARITKWIDGQPDCRRLRLWDATVDPASATSNPLGGNSGVAGAATRDGTHESAYGAFLEGKMLAPQLATIFRTARLRYGGAADLYPAFYGAGAYATNNLSANQQPNGNFKGTTGTNGTTGGTVNGSVPTNWTLSGALAGLTLTLSQVACPDLNALTGRTDMTAFRIAISGTPSANGNFVLGVSGGSGNYPLQAAQQLAQSQTAVRCNALSGCAGLSLNGLGLNGNNTFPYDQIQVALNDFLMVNQTDFLSQVPSGGPPSYVGPPAPATIFYFQSGVAVSGSLDFIFQDYRLIQAEPAPLT